VAEGSMYVERIPDEEPTSRRAGDYAGSVSQ